MTADELSPTELRQRLEEAEETMRAIREGLVDAFVVEENGGRRVYTLEGADRPYRILIEQMQQGAATLDADALITYCNSALARLLKMPLQRLVGEPLERFVPPGHRDTWQSLLRDGLTGTAEGEIVMRRSDATLVPVFITLAELPAGGGPAVALSVTDLSSQKHHADIAQAEERARHRTAQFETLLNEAPLGVYLVDADFSIRQMNPTVERAFGPLVGKDFIEFVRRRWPSTVAEELVERFRHTLGTGEAYVAPGYFEDRRKGAPEYYEWQIHRIPLPDGSHGVVCYFRNVSGQVLAQRHQNLLLNELNHRVKNTLTTVQSVAGQTLRNARTPEEAREAFESRLMALSNAHDVLTEEMWEGASLHGIVSRSLAPFRDVGSTRIEASGSDIRLKPKAALALAMALHELATNAMKYGSLSNETGRVTIAWSDGTETGDPRLSLSWVESGGPAVVKPTRRGFGGRLIEQGLAEDLNGMVRVDFRPTGVVCAIEAPLETGSSGLPERNRTAIPTGE